MIPKGTVFSALRERMFDFYPSKCRIDLRNKYLFNDWLQKGSYSPIEIKRNEIVFEASSMDVPSVFLLETELLFNNCVEHVMELNRLAVDPVLRSEAWGIVTLYYFGFFAANALLRLLGSPVIYLESGSLDTMSELSDERSQIGGGSFYLKKVRDISITTAEYKLKKMNKRLHDATWLGCLMSIEEVLQLKKSYARVDESLFFSNLTNKVLYKAYDQYGWPSSIRNKVNYRAGYAYRLVESGSISNTKKIVASMGDNYSDFAYKIKEAIGRCIPSTEEKYFSTHINVLFHTLLGYYYVFLELYMQLIERRGIDRRMHNKREDLIRRTSNDFSNYKYIKPC